MFISLRQLDKSANCKGKITKMSLTLYKAIFCDGQNDLIVFNSKETAALETIAYYG